MGADHSFYVKTIETHARAFLPLNISAVGSVKIHGQKGFFEVFNLFIFHLAVLSSKAELLQLNQTQFICLRKNIHKQAWKLSAIKGEPNLLIL